MGDFISVCSGIEAASVAWGPLGKKASLFAEIDKFPSEVLAYHYPETLNIGDMTLIAECIRAGILHPSEVLVGGTPCFTAGHMVLLDRGYVPIEDVVVGDVVVTHAGGLQRVLRVGSKLAEVGLLKAVGHPTGIICTPEHPFLTVYHRNQNTKRGNKYAVVEHVGEPSWVPAENSPGLQWCALQDFNVPSPVIRSTKFEDETAMFLAGMYLGDGWVRRFKGRNKKALSLGINASKLERMRSRIACEPGHCSVMPTGVRYTIYDTVFCEWLIENFGEKSHSKTIPAWLMSHPLRSSFLEGYFLTDGCTRGSSTTCNSTSKSLAWGVAELGNTCGYCCSVGFVKTPDSTVIQGRTVNQLDYWQIRFFEQAAARKSRVRKGFLLRKIQSYQKLPVPEVVYNIEVEEDNPFILNGAVVHNCQSYSLAGKRLGLEDPRGQLTLSWVDILDALDEVRGQGNEAVGLWENVYGVLSDAGNAFGEFLGKLAGEDGPLQPAGKKWSNAGCVFGPKRAIAWRLCDAQFFGVAQRRRRVFLVASAREGFNPAEVLFEFDGVRRDSPPSRQAGQSFTHDVAPCLTSSGRGVERTGDTRGQDPVVAGFRMAAFGEYVEDGTASTMKARDYKDATDLAVYSSSGAGYWKEGVGPLRAREQDTHEMLHIVHGTQDPCTSETTAFALGRNNGAENAVAYGCLTPGLPQRVRVHGDSGVSPTLSSEEGRGHGVPSVFTDMKVRRLMPVECERLQGFPDSWTKIPYRGKAADQCPDGARYKALGNSMAVPCMSWIGKRLWGQLTSLSATGSIATSTTGDTTYEQSLPTR